MRKQTTAQNIARRARIIAKAEELIIIGIEFSKEDENICKFEWERHLNESFSKSRNFLLS